MRTKTMPPLSKSERGLSAESIPTVSPTSSQSTMPPKTSEAVTGAAFLTTSLICSSVA